jgi:hypothetical protein
MLAPFGKPRKVSGYHGASGPKSEGRMPNRNASNAKSKAEPNREVISADTGDGSEEKHSYSGGQVGNYTRHPREGT